jgi:hypothetical protein
LRVIEFDDFVAQRLQRATYTSQRRWLRWLSLALLFLMLLATLLAVSGGGPPWLALFLAAVLLLSAAGLGHYEWAYRRRRRLRGQLQAGLRGQRFLTTILACLDDSYYLINNLKLPGRADDVDHLVVGPSGVFALEAKHHRGRIFWQDGQWFQAKMSRRGHLQPEEPIRDPVQQLKRNIDYLRTCINTTDRSLSQRTGLWIEGAVVFTHPAASLDLPAELLASTHFPVLKARDLPAHIAGHVPRHPHPAAEVRAIVGLLGHLQAPDGG